MTQEPRDPTPEEVDHQFAQIVSRLGPWQDATEASGISLGRPPGSPGAPEAPAPAPSGWGPRDYSVEEGTGDFVPPDPPALGSGRPATVLSMIAVAGAPVALLVASILWRGMPGLVLGVLIAIFMAGAVGLFFTLPRERDRWDRGPDDGARV